MAKIGKGYGSEYHLHRHLQSGRNTLEASVAQSLGVRLREVRWVMPTKTERREWKGMDFLRQDDRVMSNWRQFWPQRGNPPNWDAVAMISAFQPEEWVLFEAKANHPEFCSKPSGATGLGRKKILAALGKTKKQLGVHRDYPWEGTYYQYANRLACLYFLNFVVGVPARLVFVYFIGDCFPDGRRCPASEDDWKPLVHACHLTLGLPEKHALSERVHQVFIPVAP
jgi:hypothetical protein